MSRSKKLSLLIFFIGLMWANVAKPIEFGISGNSKAFWEGNWEYVDQLLDYLVESDVKNLRINFTTENYADLDHYNPNPDPSYEDYENNFHTALAKCDSAGIDVTLLLAYGSAYNYKNLCGTPSIPLDDRLKYPPNDEVWNGYVQEMMFQFGDEISGVEVWNEPDHIGEFFYGRVEDYINLFHIAAEQIKIHHPSLPISTGGLACRDAIYRSYLEALLNPATGIYNECDAFGLHFYNGTALGRLKVYHEVCDEMGLTPKPVWATEFARKLDEVPGKLYSSQGARAYPSQVMEIFSSYGVERAYWYCDAIDTGDGTNLFDWDTETKNLQPTDYWGYYSSAVENHQNFSIGESIGYEVDGSLGLTGISPFEDFFPDEPEIPEETQSTFEFVDGPSGSFLASHEHNGVTLPISFDINDTWVENNPYDHILLEVDISSPGGSVELRYQSCCEEEFQTIEPDQNQWNNLDCPEFLDGLTVESVIPNYRTGVSYFENTNVETLVFPAGSLSTVTVELSDWMFQNGMQKRSDISFVSVNPNFANFRLSSHF